ncbi:chaperonin 10-like protein, partial [Mycena metata]
KGPFVLRPRPIPVPAEGEVLVKIMSVGLNPIDWKQGAFNILIDEYPAVVGHDVAGVVEELGEGVEGLKKGDRVFAQTLNGGFQQYVAVPAAIILPIPHNTSFDEAATFPVAFSTACVGLFAPGPIGLGLNVTFSWDKPQQGHAALVIGGGPVGQFAIQLLKFAGFTRIVVYASRANFEYFAQLGATECIDRSEVPVESLAAHPALAPGVSVVYDAGPVSSFNAAYDAVLEGGKIVIVQSRVTLERDPKEKNLTLVRVQGYYAGPDVVKFNHDSDVVGYLATLEHTGTRYEILPNGLSGILEGLDRRREGGISGWKLVAHPHDPVA